MPFIFMAESEEIFSKSGYSSLQNINLCTIKLYKNLYLCRISNEYFHKYINLLSFLFLNIWNVSKNMSALRRCVLRGRTLPTRGGGHDHPDFPFPGFYKYKRYITIYDTNMWVYDGLRPEYLVDFQMPYITGGTAFFRNFVFVLVLPVTFCILFGKFVASNLKSPFQYQYVDAEIPLKKFMRRAKTERVFTPSHPLGHAHSYRLDGWNNDGSSWVYSKLRL